MFLLVGSSNLHPPVALISLVMPELFFQADLSSGIVSERQFNQLLKTLAAPAGFM